MTSASGLNPLLGSGGSMIVAACSEIKPLLLGPALTRNEMGRDGDYLFLVNVASPPRCTAVARTAEWPSHKLHYVKWAHWANSHEVNNRAESEGLAGVVQIYPDIQSIRYGQHNRRGRSNSIEGYANTAGHRARKYSIAGYAL